MAFEAGWETGDTSEFDISGVSAGGTMEASTEQAHIGSYSFKTSIDDDWEYSYCQEGTLGNWEQMNVRCYLYFDNLPTGAAGQYVEWTSLHDNTDKVFGWAGVYYDGTNHQIRCYNSGTVTSYYSSDIAVAEDEWNCYEVEWVRDASAGTIKAYFNDSEVLSESSLDTDIGAAYDKIRVGTLYCYADYVLYTDTLKVDNSKIGLAVTEQSTTYTIDSLLKQFDLTETYTADALLKQLNLTHTYVADSLLKQLNLTSTYSIDALLQQLNLSDTYTADMLIKQPDLLKTVVADAVLKKFSAALTYAADLVISTLSVELGYSTDLLLKQHNLIATCIVDILLKQFNIAKTYTIDAMLKQFNLTATHLADILLKQHGVSETYSIDALLSKAGVTSTYIADLRIVLQFASTYLADILLSRIHSINITINQPDRSIRIEHGIDV